MPHYLRNPSIQIETFPMFFSLDLWRRSRRRRRLPNLVMMMPPRYFTFRSALTPSPFLNGLLSLHFSPLKMLSNRQPFLLEYLWHEMRGHSGKFHSYRENGKQVAALQEAAKARDPGNGIFGFCDGFWNGYDEWFRCITKGYLSYFWYRKKKVFAST